MQQTRFLLTCLAGALALSACSHDTDPVASEAATEPAAQPSAEAAAKPQAAQWDGQVAKPGAPFSISYNIIGTPVVGSPVAVELRVSSSLGPQVIQLDYRIPDETSIMLHDAQPASIEAEFAAKESWVDQRVTIIPQREGRLYLNVSASVGTDDGRSSTTIAIPVQVGEGGRRMEEQGELATDEDGESIRILTSE